MLPRVKVSTHMRIAAILVVVLWPMSEAQAEERWALVLSGASGGPKYAEQMREWRTGISSALVDRYGFAADKVRVLVDETVKTGEQGTAANVRAAIGEIRKALTRDDRALIMLLGHGTYDGDTAKFNLVGPDLTAADWAGLLNGDRRTASRGQHDLGKLSVSRAPGRRRIES